MSKNICRFALLAITIIGFAAAANAEVLFSDNFNGVTNPGSGDYGLNANLGDGRLGGTLAADMIAGENAWSRAAVSTVDRVQVNHASFGDTMAIGSYINDGFLHNHAAVINYNFNTQQIKNAGGFNVKFDVEPIPDPQGTALYYGGGIFLGALDNTESNVTNYHVGRYDLKADLAIDVSDSKHSSATEAGSKIKTYVGTTTTVRNTAVGTTGASNWTTLMAGAGSDQWYTMELRVTLNDSSFDSGTTATAEMWWKPRDSAGPLVQADINGSLAGLSYTWTWDADGTNYMGFYGYTPAAPTNAFTEATLFDNISVSIVPEPSTFSLLACGLMGLLAYAWRKRK
ncbi:MAG: PEP-CTERM sorting domain-containing protein [Pirellulales bacterium]|nr:PEP-CTERM sorting domain-containing protein [Pirellulales bacterium]